MNSQQKLGVSVYALLWALVSLVGFRGHELVPDGTIYVLIFALFFVIITLFLGTSVSKWLAATLVLSLVCLLGLLIVDPLEVGFYGYDPYRTLDSLRAFRQHGALWIANNHGAWPAFYGLTWAVTTLIGIDPVTVGKFLPMIAAAIPIAGFLAARRLADTRTAGIVALGIVGIRTIIGFEMKFVDETLAATLFFLLVAVLAIRRDSGTATRQDAILPSLFAIAAVLSHHYVGLLVAVLLAVWTLSQSEYATKFIPWIQRVKAPDSAIRLTAVVASIGFVVVLLVVANAFVLQILGTVDVGLSDSGIDIGENARVTPAGVSPTPDTPSTRTPDTPSTRPNKGEVTASTGGNQPDSTTQPPPTDTGSGGQIEKPSPGNSNETTIPIRLIQLGVANIAVLALFGFVGYSYLRDITCEHWEAALTIFSGLLAVGYGWSVAFGPIIPLDPSRYLLYMVAPLLIVGASRLHHPWSSPPRRVFAGLILVLIVTQMVLIPPGVWYSDPAQTTVGEDHYSPTQFAASDWVAAYDGDRVVAWENGVWNWNGIWELNYPAPTVPCSVFRVWRVDANQPWPSRGHIVYNNGPVALYRCTPP